MRNNLPVLEKKFRKFPQFKLNNWVYKTKENYKVISEDIWPISEGKVPESLELPLKRLHGECEALIINDSLDTNRTVIEITYKMVTKLNMPTCVGMEPEISWLLKMALRTYNYNLSLHKYWDKRNKLTKLTDFAGLTIC